MDQTLGYGEDEYCAQAAAKIRTLCGREDVAVHFLVGGTQANLTVIDAALRPHQGALCPVGGHINVHETGAVEATGHKVLTVPSADGKITAAQVEQLVLEHRADSSFEHTVQPGMVYISFPTELGTIYSLEELTDLSRVCATYDLPLFIDGARLGYGLASPDCDVTLADVARLADVFYIGGTKVGALFGEAVVSRSKSLMRDFRYSIKQHGGMLAKGRLLGLQFETLFTNNLYHEISKEAMVQARRIRTALEALKVPMLLDCPTNQLFPILKNEVIDRLSHDFLFTKWMSLDAHTTVVRICTSWATTPENVDKLIEALRLCTEQE
jgi:threonine aldolase